MIAAYVLGPVSGAAVGLSANIIFGIYNNCLQIYGLTSLAVGLIVGVAARKGKFETLFDTMVVSTAVTVVSVAVSTPLNLLFSDGLTGNRWGDGIIARITEQGFPRVMACLVGEFYLDFLDKVLTLVLLLLGIRFVRALRNEEKKPPESHAGTLALLLAVGLTAGLAAPARAAEPRDEVDFYAYVQTVYNGENGLPVGEANDVAQTPDGVLWFGTYAGLYRYDGVEFRPMREFTTVRNVKCLYVDEEGRLWIGTNDKGLAVSINDSVSNVLDTGDGNDIGAGLDDGWVQMVELNTLIVPEGTEKALDEAAEKLQSGRLVVFQGDYIGVDPDNPADTIDLKQGYQENQVSSAPRFHYVLKDVITVVP